MGAATLGHTIPDDGRMLDHFHDMAHKADLVARTLGLPDSFREELTLASFLHDIGKSRQHIARVVAKPGDLTNAEFAILREHPGAGVEILKTYGVTDKNHPRIVRVVGRHHEMLDGSGYPNPLGRLPDLATRIVSVNDAISAHTLRRVYGETTTPEKIIKRLMGDPKLDQTIVSHIANLIERGKWEQVVPGIDKRGMTIKERTQKLKWLIKLAEAR
jgi:putative nucleotidyltransferase with HDIG domain